MRQRIALRHRIAVVLGATGVAIGLAAQAVAAGNEPPAPGAAQVEPSVWVEGTPPGRLVIPASLPPGAAQIVADRDFAGLPAFLGEVEHPLLPGIVEVTAF